MGAQVDIWHADAAGIYSDQSVENTTGQTFLRGYQITDSNGTGTFQAVLPGWYSGRTLHIQDCIYSSATQLTLTNATSGGGYTASITLGVQTG